MVKEPLEKKETQLTTLKISIEMYMAWKSLCNQKGFRYKYSRRLSELIAADVVVLKGVPNKGKKGSKTLESANIGDYAEVRFWIQKPAYNNWLKELRRLKVGPGKRATKLMENDMPTLEEMERNETKPANTSRRGKGKCPMAHELPVEIVEPWKTLCAAHDMIASGRLSKRIKENINELNELSTLDLEPITDAASRKTYAFTVNCADYEDWRQAMDRHNGVYAAGIAELIRRDTEILKRL